MYGIAKTGLLSKDMDSLVATYIYQLKLPDNTWQYCYKWHNFKLYSGLSRLLFSNFFGQKDGKHGLAMLDYPY